MEFQTNFNMTHNKAERRANFLGQTIPYGDFITFEDHRYLPCQEIILQNWARYKDFYFWQMAMMGANTCSADMTFKKAKFIIAKQEKHYASQWKGV